MSFCAYCGIFGDLEAHACDQKRVALYGERIAQQNIEIIKLKTALGEATSRYEQAEARNIELQRELESCAVRIQDLMTGTDNERLQKLARKRYDTIQVLSLELQDLKDRQEIHGQGSPGGIIEAMFDAAQRLGHPKYSSKHALSFFVKTIESQREQLQAVSLERDALSKIVDYVKSHGLLDIAHIQKPIAEGATVQTESQGESK